ncbi:MAG TPA: site-specific integrase [Saprospiraceae bacterium]|nr:site-specific integrase [Saprospiraceae bacterium]
MKDNVSISIVLDRRSPLKDGTFPVKLRVFVSFPRTQKMYSTKFAVTEADFKSIWLTTKPRSDSKEQRKKWAALEAKANEVAGKLPIFTIDDFERLMFNRTTNKDLDVNFYFEKIIDKWNSTGNISTANGYLNSLNCLLRFHAHSNINFKDITPRYLERLETHCVEVEQKSIATIGIYLRNLRTVFNEAITDKAISPDLYPFGLTKKGKYQIRTSKKVKKALTKDQMKTLFTGEAKTTDQEKAKAFWFLSYLCNGMNIADIIKLRCRDYDEAKITFIRSKTAKTNNEVKEITVYLNDYAKEVIQKYGDINQSPNDYIFPILEPHQTAMEQFQRRRAFTRYINQHFLKYAHSVGITEKISTYWARHTYVSLAVQKGASMEFVGEALGHSDTKTTMGYFSGFSNEVKKSFSQSLLDFD